MKKNIKFLHVKVSIISVLIIIVMAFFSGFYFSKNATIPKTEKEYFDLSLVHEVRNILEENFLDTRPEDAEEIVKQDHIWGAVRGLVASYKDPHTVFLPPEDSKSLDEEISGKFGGIGVEISNRSGYLTIVSPLPETPAVRAGLKPKDIIIEIEGKDSIFMSAHAAAKIMRGEPGTILRIKVVRKGVLEPFEVEIERAIIEIPIIKTYNKDGVFVIKIFSFTENSPELFLKAVQEFFNTKNQRLIIDVRGNPGGHLFASVYIAGLFLPKGTIIVTEEYGGKKEDKILRSGKHHRTNRTVNIFPEEIKIAVLVDGGSASASEIIAGALRDNNRAILMGENTYGKGTVQQLKKLEGGTLLKYTVARWVMPKGEWISHKGIPVDIEISISDEEIKEARKSGLFADKIDPQLLRAIEKMKNINSQDEILEIIKKGRKEVQEKVKEERKEKLKSILEE